MSSDFTSHKAVHVTLISMIQKLVHCIKLCKGFKAETKESKDVVSSKNEPSNTHRKGKRVTFHHVDIRIYKRILTEHPECKDGLALGLDWKHAERITRISIELFEQIRKRQGRGKKPMERLSFHERRTILILIGGYREEILRDIMCGSGIQIPNLNSTKAKAA
jgi:hypothetical protein